MAVWVLVVDSDQELACVKWRSTENGNKRQGEGFREGLEHSRAHAQGEWDGPIHPAMAAA